MASNLPDLDALIDEKIDLVIKRDFDFSQSLDPKLGQVMVQFFDGKAKSKRKTSWFGGKEDPENFKLWESWIVHIKCLPTASDPATGATAGTSSGTISLSVESFETNLNKIIDIADTHKEHIPPITSLDSSPFPYTIEVDHKPGAYESSGNEGWGDYIRKILD